MNIRRTAFWLGFVIVLALIVWGLVVALNKPPKDVTPKLGTPAPVSAADHVSAASDTPVTLIEYSDFQCPACQSYYPLVTRLLSEASTSLRLVYRHFPLNDPGPGGRVTHPNALIAAQASEAAGKQGKFWEMYKLLFENHAEWTELKDPRAVFVRYASTLGLNLTPFEADLDSAAIKDFVMAQKKEGVAIGVNSTPTFFVNGKGITNPRTYDEFKSIIETAARAGSR